MTTVEEQLRLCLQQTVDSGDEAKMEQTIELARAVFRNQKQQVDLPFRGLLLSQLRFLGWKVWLGQAGLLLVLGILIKSFSSQDTAYLLARHGPYLLSCTATLVLTMALPLMQRSRRWQMDEAEAATAYSYPGLLGARLLLLFLGDALLLLAVGLLAASHAVLPPERIVLYLLLPFLLLAAGYMAVLESRSVQRFERSALVMSGTVLVILSFMDARWPGFYHGTFNGGWLVVSLLLFAVIANRWLGMKKRSGGWGWD